MEELLIEYGGEILEGLAGLIFGAAAVFLVYKVAERITESNVVELLREAIHKKKTDLAKKAVGKLVGAYIKETKPNEISFSVLLSECKELEGQDIKIESSAGVDPALKPGMKIKFRI